MRRILGTILLCALSAAALAAPPEVFDARLVERPTFDYAAATARHPLFVQAETPDGKCRFTVSLIGLQEGAGAAGGGALVGRVELKQCFADAHLKWASVVAIAEGVAGKSVLEPIIHVALQRY